MAIYGNTNRRATKPAPPALTGNMGTAGIRHSGGRAVPLKHTTRKEEWTMKATRISHGAYAGLAGGVAFGIMMGAMGVLVVANPSLGA